MGVKYSWNRQNGAAMPSVRFMSIEPAEDYYKGMPLKLKEKGIVEPTDGDPEYICMAEYNPDAEIQPLEIPVQEVFPDVVYDRMNDDGTIEEVRFGSKGGGVGDLLETVETEVPLVITWDGNAEGKETTPVEGSDQLLVKVSDAVLSMEQLVGSTVTYVTETENLTLEITEDLIFDATSQGMPMYMLGDSLAFIVHEDINQESINLTKGVWFATYPHVVYYTSSLTCPNATTTTTKQQIKTEFLPDGYPYEKDGIVYPMDTKFLPEGIGGGGVSEERLTEAINTALAQAKESGEFDGDSVTVTNVQESTADGGSNIVTFSDGKTLTVKNGSKGSTPVKGTDYYTAADKTEMVNAVIAALPTWNGGSY